MRSGNPALNEKTFRNYYTETAGSANAMTVQGTAWKTLILLGMCAGTACFTWTRVANGEMASAMPLIFGGAIGGLIAGLATSFKPTWAPVTAPIYALLQGLFLGGISAIFEQTEYKGIALQAIAATFGTMFALLLAYQSGFIRATENFKLGVFAATGGIAMLYLVSFVLSFFGMPLSFINEPSWLGIGFSVFVVIIAALNLVLDFDFIENAANNGAPKYMEWYGAYGLMVTLVWLYIEILRLLSKLNSRD